MSSDAAPAPHEGTLREGTLNESTPRAGSRWALDGRDALALVLLALLALGGLVHPFDAGWLLSGDALYPIQMLHTPVLAYRPAPPNRLFPDVAVQALAALVSTDLLTQKILAGAGLLLLVSLCVSIAKGRTALLLTLAILCACGFGCLDSACHFSLPLLVVLYQAARRPGLRLIALFAAVFSDPMVLLPLVILWLRGEGEPGPAGSPDRRPGPAEGACVLAAFGLNTLYAEFSLAFVHVLVLVPAWAVGFWLARRRGLLDPACVTAILALVAASWLGIVPARYGLPVAASMALLFFPGPLPTRRIPRRRGLDPRAVLWPAAVAGLFLLTADTGRAHRLTTAFDCLSATLAARGIETVAADHWSAKPLALAVAAAGRATHVVQVGFDDGRVHPWVAPHSSYGPPTPWGIGNRDTCAHITDEARYCGQADVAPVVSREPVCGIFDLYRYAVPLPLVPEAPPAGKWAAIGRNARVYLDKALGLSALGPLRRLTGGG